MLLLLLFATWYWRKILFPSYSSTFDRITEINFSLDADDNGVSFLFIVIQYIFCHTCIFQIIQQMFKIAWEKTIFKEWFH